MKRYRSQVLFKEYNRHWVGYQMDRQHLETAVTVDNHMVLACVCMNILELHRRGLVEKEVLL